MRIVPSGSSAYHMATGCGNPCRSVLHSTIVRPLARKSLCSASVRAIALRLFMSGCVAHGARPDNAAGFVYGRASGYAGTMVRVIHRGGVVDLRVETVPLPNGVRADLELIAHRGAAAVAAVDESARVILIRQFRYAARGYLWELPAGVLDGPDEAPVHCAARELAGEVGLVARELCTLGMVLPSPGLSEERIHLFLRRGLTGTPTAPP